MTLQQMLEGYEKSAKLFDKQIKKLKRNGKKIPTYCPGVGPVEDKLARLEKLRAEQLYLAAQIRKHLEDRSQKCDTVKICDTCRSCKFDCGIYYCERLKMTLPGGEGYCSEWEREKL